MAADIDAEETADRFNLTREQQLQLADSIEELEITGQEYQNAVDNGSDEKARQLARELLTTAEELNQTTTELNEQYDALETETGIDFNVTQESISVVQRTVQRAAAGVIDREFTETNITVETNQTTLAASDPLRVSGQLTTVDGAPIKNASVSVSLGEDSITTRTTETGQFETTYRPLLASTSARNLTVAYTPTGSEPFLPVTETVPVSITEQAATSIELENTTQAAAFTEPIQATGQVIVAAEYNRSLAGIPIVLTLDQRRIATAETNSSGRFMLSASMPETIPAGDANLQVSIDRREMAIERSMATAPITVRSTRTDLSIDPTVNGMNGTQNVTVGGQLRTADGDPLSDRSIRVTIGETTLGTVETNASGGYQATYELPAGLRGSDITVTATFEGTGTNLAASAAQQRVPLPSAGPGVGRVLAGIVGGGLLVMIVIVVLFPSRGVDREWITQTWARVTDSVDPATDSETTITTAPSATTGLSDNGRREAVTQASLHSAREALAAGHPNVAVQSAYAAVRSRLQSSDSLSTPQTHWEFYRQLHADHEIDTAQLAQVTEAYETATYSADGLSSDAAAETLSAVEELIGDSGTSSTR
ncbi:hypothetical protein [Halorubrum ezzemoulense]|uniref:hypothetical protein n=1 Tax=Halorubrum ezzemoulense TaxID=337243 RepID=UPI00232B01B6|nr:hypothetical protein [Halorubrum ezzemoulense]MDB9235652.1 hypothetical protein [Halorubrum ezzemoulense]MDB9253007.1 hypothetical protein [Halorubrum ezzemoulense]MDB9255280.1 hypothetical protein [Halorubrum ezzemoulense]MDB9275991.1 hypothetical protein [Halorubrum ezzemoulense]